jgi:hypothetical protein
MIDIKFDILYYLLLVKLEKKKQSHMNVVRTVFHTVDVRSSGPSNSVISCRVHSSLLQKEQQSVKGPDGFSTAGTPMPKLKLKRNIVLQRTINQYAK